MNIIPTAIRNRCFRRTTASIRCVKVSKLCNWFKTKINLVVVRTFQYLMAWKTIRSLVFRKFQCFPTGNRSICARNGKEYFNLGEWCECEDIYIRWSENLSLSLSASLNNLMSLFLYVAIVRYWSPLVGRLSHTLLIHVELPFISQLKSCIYRSKQM